MVKIINIENNVSLLILNGNLVVSIFLFVIDIIYIAIPITKQNTIVINNEVINQLLINIKTKIGVLSLHYIILNVTVQSRSLNHF